MKVTPTIVWHECGHLFGYTLVEEMYNEYREIIKFSLTKEKAFIQERQKELPHNNTELVKTILIFVMGAVFHVHKFKLDEEIRIRDFRIIFLNTDYLPKKENLFGHAGKDFTYLTNLIRQEQNNTPPESLICLSYELEKTLQNHKIFCELEELISLISQKYNGKKIEGKDLLVEEKNKIAKKISTELKKEIIILVKNFIK